MASLAEESGEDPTSGDVFVFCGKTKTTIKILYWVSAHFPASSYAIYFET
jgi:transposase